MTSLLCRTVGGKKPERVFNDGFDGTLVLEVKRRTPRVQRGRD